MSNDYTSISKILTSSLDKEIKDAQGIFFSPPESIVKCINYIDHILKHKYKTVLEPSCGSCEFINRLDKKKDLDITGIEYNDVIYDTIKNIDFNNNVQLYNADFLEHSFDKKYDLIIGNPPYFVYNKKNIQKKYHKYLSGRPNIFLIFILKSLELLTVNGILAFILPKSFLNCSYYQKVREYIYNNYHVKTVLDCSNHSYIETEQDTFILIIKNTKRSFNNDKYFVKNNYLMNTKKNIEIVKTIMEDSTTLHNLNFEVFNGKFVWNQEKHSLTNDEKNTRLIYSSDIIDGHIKTLKNEDIIDKWKTLSEKYKQNPTKSLKDKLDKKHYVDDEKNDYKSKLTKGMSLIINRGYGNTNYNLTYGLVTLDKYYLENHVLAIKYKKSNNLENKDLEKLYQKIILSLKDPRTKQFIDICMGNNAMNTTELEYLLPIFI